MSDLISRLSELRSQYNCFDETERDAYHTLSEAIEALQVQKTGKWMHISKWKNEFDAVCSECGQRGKTWMNFCPNCGSRMECEKE